MIQKREISKILLVFLTDTLKNYDIELKRDSKIFINLYLELQELNKLFENNFVFYHESVSKEDAKINLNELNAIHGLLKSAYGLIKSKFPADIEEKITQEYKKIIEHFNNEYAALKYLIQKDDVEKAYKVKDAIKLLEKITNV